jgi:hypothetical protein
VWDDVFSWFTLFSVIFLYFFLFTQDWEIQIKRCTSWKMTIPKDTKKKRENKGTACAGLGASLRWLSAGALCWRQAGVTDL